MKGTLVDYEVAVLERVLDRRDAAELVLVVVDAVRDELHVVPELGEPEARGR
jgi:hypothetical protein